MQDRHIKWFGCQPINGGYTMERNRKLILEGSLVRAILTLAIPIMLNNLIQSLYNIGDAFWVSRMGDVQVAAVNFVWPVTFLTISFATGIAVAGAAMISQYIGANQVKEANETAQQLYIFALFFGIIACAIGMVFTPAIVKLMGAKGELLSEGTLYLRIIFIQVPFLFMMNIFLAINQAQGDTITPMILNASSAILNIILDPIFIFVFDLGIQGAAWATVMSMVPFSLFGIYRLTHGLNYIKIFPHNLKINYQKMKMLIRMGIPSSMGSSGVAFGFIILFSFVVQYGDSAVAALGIGNRLNSLAFMPAVGVGAALTTITGQNLGANQVERVKKAYRISIALALVFLFMTTSIIWFFAPQLVSIFSNTQEVVQHGTFYLRALAMTTWSISFFNCALGLLNGSGHTLHAMFLDAGRLWLIRIPLILLLGHFTSLGPTSVWIAVSISNPIASVIAFIVTLTGVWKTPKVRDLHIISE